VFDPDCGYETATDCDDRRPTHHHHVEECHRAAFAPVAVDPVYLRLSKRDDFWRMTSDESLPSFKCSVPDVVLSTALRQFWRSANGGGVATLRQREIVLQSAWDEAFSRIENLKHWVPVKRDPALEAAGWYGPNSFL
jgi:hypothetical protein